MATRFDHAPSSTGLPRRMLGRSARWGFIVSSERRTHVCEVRSSRKHIKMAALDCFTRRVIRLLNHMSVYDDHRTLTLRTAPQTLSAFYPCISHQTSDHLQEQRSRTENTHGQCGNTVRENEKHLKLNSALLMTLFAARGGSREGCMRKICGGCGALSRLHALSLVGHALPQLIIPASGAARGHPDPSPAPSLPHTAQLASGGRHLSSSACSLALSLIIGTHSHLILCLLLSYSRTSPRPGPTSPPPRA